ncbi:MAG: type IX secretion system membrane protein PorP/SprF [Bacteroidetes bacterium]|nr:type IX secretion system membrane protein PorP/SprF [Bacteroidota bacterium]
MKKLLLSVSCIFFLWLAHAQQQAQYSMYRFNGLYINPAYSGSHDVLNVTAIYRHQWVNAPGLPQSASVALHSPLKNERIALGLIYNFDKIGVSSTNQLNASFAYRIPVGKKKQIKLSLGLSAGFTNYRSNLNNVVTSDAGDPNFSGNSINRWLPQLGFGFYAYSDKFFAGFSVPQLFAPTLDGPYSVFSLSNQSSRQYHQLLFTSGYVFNLGKKVRFIPSGLLKVVPAHAPVSFDLNATFVFIDRIWFGVGYRYVDAYNFMVAANITKQFRLAYCYDLAVSPLSKYTTGSHEIMVSFDFRFEKGKVVNPRYLKYF